MRAVRTDDLEIVSLLVENGAIIKENDMALITATRSGNGNIVKYLLSKGADVSLNGYKALFESCSYSNFEAFKVLTEGQQISTELLNNCLNDCQCNVDIIKYSIEKLGFPVENKDNMLLKQACAFGEIELIDYLVSKGAELNYNFLKLVITNNRCESFIHLVDKHKMDISKKIDGLLEEAYFSHATEVFDLLLKHIESPTPLEKFNSEEKFGVKEVFRIKVQKRLLELEMGIGTDKRKKMKL